MSKVVNWSVLAVKEYDDKIFDEYYEKASDKVKKVIDEHHTEASYQNPEHHDTWTAIWEAKNARSDLCNNGPFFWKSRKFVLITIQDIENKRIMDIIVRRKDID